MQSWPSGSGMVAISGHERVMGRCGHGRARRGAAGLGLERVRADSGRMA